MTRRTKIRKTSSKGANSAKDREESRKFLLIVGIATLALILLMYFLFVGG
ncbi:MAG: hypothetical protein R2792_12940 [Saprospiraceae bacterium]